MEDTEGSAAYRDKEKETEAYKKHGYSSLSFKEYIVLQREKKKRVQKIIVTFLIVFGILFFPVVYIVAIIVVDKNPPKSKVMQIEQK